MPHCRSIPNGLRWQSPALAICVAPPPGVCAWTQKHNCAGPARARRLRGFSLGHGITHALARSWPLAAVLFTVATPAASQSLLDRTPNLTGGWVGAPNSLHFTFLHRFNQSGAPARQVTNRPTFLLAYAAPVPLLIGAQYATRSDVAERYPNEWEAFARYRLLPARDGLPLELAAQAAYNVAAESLDGELSAAARAGPLRVLVAARALQSGYGRDTTRFAVGGGATLRIGNWFALAGDIATLLDANEEERSAWGVGLQFGIPLTPHSLSLQATNTNSATLQGASRGASETRWGFEFTVPVVLARYFGRRGTTAAVDPAAPPTTTEAAARAALADSIRAEVRREYEARWREDSLRLTLRGDSARLAQQLDSVRRAAQQDSVARAQAEAARRAAEEQARRAQPARRVNAGMRNLAYEPARITIDAGTTIVWRNNDQVEHTVTALDRSWDSGTIRPGATWERTFSRAGTYEFFCTPHPFMKGVVVVRPAP